MDLEANVERFRGFADIYERFRPSPPEILAEILSRYARVDFPSLVVDLGCGTGLSTRYWAAKAGQVIGIDPSADMLNLARKNTTDANIRYQEGFSHQTGLPDHCAQIVTTSQALHWMEPQPTFVEAARILQTGGVFAAYDYDWPPVTFSWQFESAYERFNKSLDERLNSIEGPKATKWDKQKHLQRVLASGCFRYGREIVLNYTDTGSAERMVGLIYSLGSAQSLLKLGLTEKEIGLVEMSELVKQIMGDGTQTWYWCIRLRLGIV